MKPILVYEIKKEDIGKCTLPLGQCQCCGKKNGVIVVSSLMGRILPIDIGKRIYRVGDIYQVENQEQLSRRLQKVC